MYEAGDAISFFIQITWGILQSLIGFVGFLIHIRKQHYWYKGCVVTIIKGNWGGVSLGAFIFIDEDIPKEQAKTSDFINHEWGHTWQSMFLGPLYLFVIGIPSLIWSRVYTGDYNRFYTERWANMLGGVEKGV